MPNSSTVLVIAAHPDDEVLGCGATIAKHVQRGDNVHIIILSEGATSRALVRDRKACQEELLVLNKAAIEASKVLGVNSICMLDFPDNRMDKCELLDVIKAVEKKIDQHHPDIVYTHHNGDVNIDHRRIHEATVTACRPVPGHSVKTLLFFEVASSTEWQTYSSAPPFVPNWFINVEDTLSIKLKALEIYQSELRKWPHPRSIKAIEHLARWRGASVGFEAAEAFILGRNLIF
jgi:N-acetylglucosamine malate deacetylase 1